MASTVVFDLDGTLVDSAPDIMATLNHLLQGEGLSPLPLSAARSLVGAGARALLERGFKAAGRPLDEARLEVLFAAFLAHYLDHIADHSTLFPGVEAALDTLAAQGHILAICTNKPEPHAIKLVNAFGLLPRFRFIAGRETFSFCKPDARHLTHTINAAKGDARRALLVGDSRTDVDTARAAGLPVIGVSFGYTDVPMVELQPDITIDHFDGLAEAVRHIHKQA